MAVKHTIMTGTGRTRNVNLTPRRAIRLRCYDCSAFQWAEVKKCETFTCPLWPYRNDGPPSEQMKPKAEGGRNHTTK
jgi:hypothetical protein